MLKNKPGSIFLAAIFFINIAILFSHEDASAENKVPISIRKGVWVTAFSKEKALYSRKKAFELIKFCKKSKINEIYLQLYRADQAYYDSKITDRSKYEYAVKSSGMDTIDFLLKEADKNNIKIFAWISVFSLAQNKKANIIAKFGDSVLTRDQYLRPSIRTESINETDKYYLRDEQLFLEPGDPRVGEYIVSIVNEIIARYPAISGIHLDYVRYPYAIPFLPRSSFKKYGIAYGYGEKNIEAFKEATGLDALSMADENDNFLRWDNWKREKVTGVVEHISKSIKKSSPRLLVSCAVMPSPDISYSVNFQDWPAWLEKGIVDYVVLMNYTKNNELTEEIVRSALAHRGKGRVLAGLGVFLMKGDQKLLSEQYSILKALKVDGIVFFSYDDIVNKYNF